MLTGQRKTYSPTSRIERHSVRLPFRASKGPLQADDQFDRPQTVKPEQYIPKLTANMVFPAQQIYLQASRLYSSRAGGFSRGDQVGAALTAAYCCLAFSAPFAGAALASRNARKDDRYAKL
jgi:hypothetical protein